ncbi:MAG: hypothetical protein ACYC2P_05170 [Paludibacteraceae bacterium]
MRTYSTKTFNRFNKLIIYLAILIFSTSFYSCKDDYIYDNESPDGLGSSIYDYLKENGNFTTTVKLIDDLQYAEVLRLTGSKTLFVAKDSAYNEFFKNNEWGVKKYEDLTLAQKKSLLNYAMLNNAYTLKKLSNYNSGGTLIEETAMRQETSLAPIDSIAFDKGDKLPTSNTWNYYRDKGIHLLKDNTAKPIVYFTEEFLNKAGFTEEDFATLTNGMTRSMNDVYVFNNKIIQRDVRCKNGYIQVMKSVLIPPKNMADYIQDNSSTKIFSKLLDRFSVMVYDNENTKLYKSLHPEFNDSIFNKTYYASNGGVTRQLNSNHEETSTGQLVKNILPFDPGWNKYNAGVLEADMAAMFVPTDEAMNNYFNSGVGAILKSRFGSWDNVPDEIILPFIKRHMRTSVIESVPSKFSKMVDGENYSLPVQKSHIVSSYLAVNGNVYITNEVYPPVDYISVYSPVLLSSNSKIMNWAINISQRSVDGTMFAFYKLYLNSLVSKYSLFIPTDEYFIKYIDPIAYGQEVSGVLKYWYNEKTSSVNATVYKYDKTNDIVGDSVDVITSSSFLQNRLWDILDSHIVVGDVESGKDYYVTKANDIIKVSGSGSSMVVRGGGDIAMNTQANATRAFRQYNGNTYFLDKQIQPSLKSVYKVLSENPEFSMFFDLLNGVPEGNIVQIFAQQGIDYRIKFFNAFRYTVYVPTNAAVQKAIDNHVIMTWQAINNLSGTEKQVAVNKLINFLKYHFQDNAVFFGDNVNGQYQSATLKTNNTLTHFGTVKNKYYKLGINGTSGSMIITMDTPAGAATRTANVVTTSGLYNIIAKDYIFAKLPSAYKYVDGTGSLSGALFYTSSISTSASAVIHQIDNVLTFE